MAMNSEHVDINELMEKYGVSDRVKGYMRDCVKFHTFPAAGLLLGVFMVDLALEKLNAKPGDKLYAVSESGKCLPDAVQVITHCTYGNHKLRIINTGRFSVTFNRFSEGKSSRGVRVFIDVAKIGAYPTLKAWYLNDPNYKGGVDGKNLLDDIMRAGTKILSWENVDVHVSSKEKWTSVMCPSCGEMVPENTLENGLCRGCGPGSYYSKVTAEIKK